jgi:teichuronic acid exporter
MSLRKEAISGFMWTLAQQFSGQIIGFAVSIILARLILPEEFGLIGMIAIFMGIGSTFISSGLTQSLIRSKDATDLDFSTVFYFNLVVGILMYVLVFISAPYIALFFEQPSLILLIKVYCTIFIIQAIGAVQITRLTKKMDFKTQLKINLPSLIIGSIVGISMALSGYGVWSLVWSAIVQSLAANIQVWFWSKWRPLWKFDKTLFVQHWKYGYKLLLSGLLNSVFSNIYPLIIGKYFLPSQVGFYQRANNLKDLPVTNISNALNKVTFPLFAKIQDENQRLKDIYKKIMQVVVFVISPILFLMAALGEPLFRFLFTETWLPAVPYFQILCLSGVLYPIHSYNLNILTVKGLSGLFLRLEVIKKILLVILLFFGFQFGIYGLLIASVLGSVLALFVNSYFTGKYIDYGVWSQFGDLLPIITTSLSVGIGIYFLDQKAIGYLPDILRLLIGGILGVGLFLALSNLLKLQALKEIRLLIQKK